MSRRRDSWTILGVNYGAGEDEIKQAYRKLAKRFHPDLHPGDQEAAARFQEINEANEDLMKRIKRTRDRQERLPQTQRAADEPGEDAWAPPLVSEELHGPLTINFEQAYRGGEVAATLDGTLRCQRCDGHGRRSGEHDLCSTCSGVGVFGGPHSIVVRVPAGVADGVKLPAFMASRPDRHVGDVVVRVRPSPLFMRPENDENLVIELPLTYSEAALGASVRVPTPGRWVSLKIPSGTAEGKLLRLNGRGMPKPGSEERGHLFARIRIVVPRELSARQQKLLEELKGLDVDPRRSAYGSTG